MGRYRGGRSAYHCTAGEMAVILGCAGCLTGEEVVEGERKGCGEQSKAGEEELHCGGYQMGQSVGCRIQESSENEERKHVDKLVI